MYLFNVHQLSLGSSIKGNAGILVVRNPELRSEQDNDGNIIPNSNQYLVFWDLMKERALRVKKTIQNDPDEFRIEIPDDITIKLVPMTLALYQERVLPKLDGDPKIKTEAQLRTHFLETIDVTESPAV